MRRKFVVFGLTIAALLSIAPAQAMSFPAVTRPPVQGSTGFDWCC